MKAVEHIGPREVRVVERAELEPGPGEVRVAMRVGGLCGSDLHRYRKAPSDRMHNVLGHEPCGVVDRLGAGVTRPAIGDRVSVYHYAGCGYCEWCRRGEIHWCEDKRVPGWHTCGSCGTQVVIKAEMALPLPEGMSFEQGAIVACGGSTTWGALTKVRPTTEDAAVVWGLGPIGLSGVAMLKAFGSRVVAVGRRRSRLELARDFGADEVIDIDRTPEAGETIRRMLPRGASLAYETSGTAQAQRQMIDTLGPFGRAVCVGLGSNEPAINLGRITGKQMTLYGSHVMNLGEYDAMLRFLQYHDLHLDRMITHALPYDRGAEAFEVADRGDCGKVVLVADDA